MSNQENIAEATRKLLREEISIRKRAKLIAALEKLREASDEIVRLWDDNQDPDSVVSEFDDALTQEYPFAESFNETHHGIIVWTDIAILRLKTRES